MLLKAMTQGHITTRSCTYYNLNSIAKLSGLNKNSKETRLKKKVPPSLLGQDIEFSQVEHILAKFGGPTRMARAFAKAGIHYSRQSLSQWRRIRTGLVPQAAWPAIHNAARAVSLVIQAEDMDPNFYIGDRDAALLEREAIEQRRRFIDEMRAESSTGEVDLNTRTFQKTRYESQQSKYSPSNKKSGIGVFYCFRKFKDGKTRRSRLTDGEIRALYKYRRTQGFRDELTQMHEALNFQTSEGTDNPTETEMLDAEQVKVEKQEKKDAVQARKQAPKEKQQSAEVRSPISQATTQEAREERRAKIHQDARDKTKARASKTENGYSASQRAHYKRVQREAAEHNSPGATINWSSE